MRRTAVGAAGSPHHRRETATVSDTSTVTVGATQTLAAHAITHVVVCDLAVETRMIFLAAGIVAQDRAVRMILCFTLMMVRLRP